MYDHDWGSADDIMCKIAVTFGPYKGVVEVAGLLTPMPGGTGPMTIAMLLRNTLTAARTRRLGVAVPGT